MATKQNSRTISMLGALALTLAAAPVLAHGPVTPGAVNTEGLPELGTEWADTNPFREDEKLKPTAMEVGASGYN